MPKPTQSDNPEPKPSETQSKVQLLTLDELAAALRLPALQLRKMAQTGQIPGVKVERAWMFNKDLVQKALQQRSRGR
jgi:excisionase family DNA binding protein